VPSVTVTDACFEVTVGSFGHKSMTVVR